MKPRAIHDEFPYQHKPLPPYSEEKVAQLIERCLRSFSGIVDWTDMGGGITTLTRIKAMEAALAAGTGVCLDTLTEVISPLPTAGWEKLVRQACAAYAKAGHLDAEVSIATMLKSAQHPSREFSIEMTLSSEGVRVSTWIPDEINPWTECFAHVLDPEATLTRKGGLLRAESQRGTKFYHNHQTRGLCFLGVQFEKAEAGRAVAEYVRICADPSFKVVSRKNDSAIKAKAKSERWWSLCCFDSRKGGSTPGDDLKLLQAMGLPLLGCEIVFSWGLVDWRAWRGLKSVPVEFKDDGWRSSALFAFVCPSGKSALLELILTHDGKFKPSFRFADEADSTHVYQTLGLKWT